jgi:hypothetical protein
MRGRGTGSVYQRGGVWWVCFYHRGKQHRESTHSTEEKDAHALLKRRLGEMHSGTFTPREDRVYFEDLLKCKC